jgi:uncharacterized protein (TIGR02001 family)
MKKLILAAVAATALCTTSALAADLKPILKAPPPAAEPSPWDWAFGGATMTDYNFRGISQSNRGPSVTAYSETRYNVNANWQLYAGAQYWAVTLPTKPTCECDFYAGIRPTVGPFAFDFGFIYYWYPREQQQFVDVAGRLASPVTPGAVPFTTRDTDYYEGYGKVTWEAIKDKLWLGVNEYYSPDWLNTGAYGNYLSGTAKVGLPAIPVAAFGLGEIGWYISGELGHYWLGRTGAFFGNVDLPDYTTWNFGVAFTWKVATFDFRYYDTDLTKAECFALTGDLHGLVGGSNVGGGAGVGASKWCGSAFIFAAKFDLTAMTNLK